MPILQLNTSEMLQLSPTLVDQASSLKKSLTSPTARRTPKMFNSLMSPKLHSPAKQLETNLIKIRISKFIVEVQQKKQIPGRTTSLQAINQRYSPSPCIFSLSPKIGAMEELNSLSLSSEWLLAPELQKSTQEAAKENVCLNATTPSPARLNSKAQAFVPKQKLEKYVPPQMRKRSGVRPANVDWRTGETMAEPIRQPRLRLVPWFHTLSKEQKQEHNRQCAARRIVARKFNEARQQVGQPA